MANFNEEYFKEFTDEYIEYNSKFKILTDYQKEEITKKIDNSSEEIIKDVDNLEKNIMHLRMILSIARDCLRLDRSFKAFKEVLIYRGILDNLVKYEKSNGVLSNNKKHTECPIDVRLQVVHNTSVYDAEGKEHIVEYVEKGGFTVYSFFYMSFRWNDYKVTWFLKKDKSE